MNGECDGSMSESEAIKEPRADTSKVKYVKVREIKPEGYDGTCLRPLGMCDLGSCDVCWHNPEHPRFKESASDQ